MSAQSQNGRSHNGHLNDETMQRFQARSLAVDELRAAHQHLNGCGTCRRALLARVGPVRLPEELAEIPEPVHLSYENLTAYIDGTLPPDEKARAEAHLFLCASCTREITGLRKFDAQLAASASTAKAEAAAAAPKESLVVRLARFFAVPGRMRELGVAFGVIVVGLFLFQAGNGATAVSRTADRIIHLGSDSTAGLSVGGFALVAAGLAYMVYSLFRKR